MATPVLTTCFRALNQAAGGAEDFGADPLGGDIHDEILDELNEEGGPSLTPTPMPATVLLFIQGILTAHYPEDDDEIDELEEEVDDYDDYDMDQGSDGDMEGSLNHHAKSVKHVANIFIFSIEDDLLEPWGWEGDEVPAPRHHHHRFRGGAPPAWATVTEIMPGRGGTCSHSTLPPCAQNPASRTPRKRRRN